jgi:hypothetical protein
MSSEVNSETLANRRIGAHWTPSNLTTLIDWLWTSIYIIECLEISIIHSRTTLRYNTILGLILSTLTGTLNITQFNLIDNYYVNLVIKIFLTLMAFTITVNTGRIKIYQYQESLEDYIRIKQEWIQFAVNIAAELQLPIDLRQDALYIIENYKGKYLDLLKAESEIGERVKEQIRKMMELDDIKFNHLIQKYNYIMDMKDNSDFDLNAIMDEYDKIHVMPNITKGKKLVTDKDTMNKMVKNFLSGNQVSVYGVKISNLILNLVFKEKFDLNILQRQEFYDSDKDLTELYDLLSMMEMNKKNTNLSTNSVQESTLVNGFNTDPFNTWKSAFRECAKLASRVIARQQDAETQERLRVWCDESKDQYAIDGSTCGREYGIKNKTNLQALKMINDFVWLKEQFDGRYSKN